MAKRWAEIVEADEKKPDGGDASPGAILSLAYPDRIARQRGAGGAYVLANGRGANLDPASALSREPFLVVAELSGTAAQGRSPAGCGRSRCRRSRRALPAASRAARR